MMQEKGDIKSSSMNNLLDDIDIQKINKAKSMKKRKKMRKRVSLNKDEANQKAYSLREKNIKRMSEIIPKYSSMRGSDVSETPIIRRPRSISLPEKKFQMSKESAEKITLMLKENKKKMPKVMEALKRMEQYNKSQRQMIEKLQITNSNLREILMKMKDSMMVELQMNDRFHKKLSILRKINEEMHLIKKPRSSSISGISGIIDQDSLLGPSICVTCKWRKRNVVLLPCSHFILCENCANSLPRLVSDSKSRCCPNCRSNVIAVIKCKLDAESNRDRTNEFMGLDSRMF